MNDVIMQLRERLSALETQSGRARETAYFQLGVEEFDQSLNGGLALHCVHEILPQTHADSGAASGFVAGLVRRVLPVGQSFIWIRQALSELETGQIYGPGLAAYGLDPNDLIMMRLSSSTDIIRAGLEAARCSALGAVVIEIWGDCRTLDLAVTRRLSLIAGKMGMTIFLLRPGSQPQPSAAVTRWQVRARPSQSLIANAPGQPRFFIKLLRSRFGHAGKSWELEWDTDQHVFHLATSLPRPLAAVPVSRPVSAALSYEQSTKTARAG